MPKNQQSGPYYKQVAYFIDQYGKSGAPDQRAAQTFVDCENAEMIRSLRNELTGIAKGTFSEKSMDRMLTAKRRQLFGSYQQWAKMMLLWLSAYKG